MKWKNDTTGMALDGGVYDAVCCSIIDIGTQHGEWQGKEKIKRQCIIGWELLDETYEKDGETKRCHASEFYTQSLDPRATLRKHLKGWRGRDFTPEELAGFEPKNILGKPCSLMLELTDKGKNRVEAISKYKGTDQPSPEGDIRYFMMTDDDGNITFNGYFPEWMSDGIKKLIEKSDEYRIITGDLVPVTEPPESSDYVGDAVPPENEDDKIPF